MIRNTLFGISVLALSAGSAFASPVKHTVTKKTPVVAQADTSAPAGDAAKPAKKEKASKKGGKKASKTEGAKELKGATPAPEAK